MRVSLATQDWGKSKVLSGTSLLAVIVRICWTAEAQVLLRTRSLGTDREDGFALILK